MPGVCVKNHKSVLDNTGFKFFISGFWLLNLLPSEVVQSFNLEVFKLQFNKAMVDLFQCWKRSSFKWEIRQSRSLLPMEISVILKLNYIYHLFPQSWKLNFYNYMKSWKYKGNLLKLRLEIAEMAVLKSSRAWESLHNKLNRRQSQQVSDLTLRTSLKKILWDLILGILNKTVTSNTIIKICPSCITLAFCPVGDSARMSPWVTWI